MIVQATFRFKIDDDFRMLEVHQMLDEFLEPLAPELVSLIRHGQVPVGRPRSQRDGAREWLKAFLADGPAPAGEIVGLARTAGYAQRTLYRAADEIGVVKSPAQGGPNVIWRLAELAKTS